MEDKKIKVLEELAKQSDEEYMKILKNNACILWNNRV